MALGLYHLDLDQSRHSRKHRKLLNLNAFTAPSISIQHASDVTPAELLMKLSHISLASSAQMSS